MSVLTLGPRPILKNVTDEEIRVFRDHTILMDEIGAQDVKRDRGVANISDKTHAKDNLIIQLRGNTTDER